MDELSFRADLTLSLLAGRAEAMAHMQRRHNAARTVDRLSRAANRSLNQAIMLLDPAFLHRALCQLARRTRRLLHLVTQQWDVHTDAAWREDVLQAQEAVGALIRYQLQQLRSGTYASFAPGAPCGGATLQMPCPQGAAQPDKVKRGDGGAV